MTAGSGARMTSYPNSVCAAAAHGAVLHCQLGDLRHHRPTQPLGDRRPQHRALGVARVLAEEDEVGRLTLEHGGEHTAGRQCVASRRPRRR